MHRDCQSPSCKFDWLWRNVRLEKRRKSACIHVWYVIVQKSDTRIDDTVAANHWSVTSLETVGLPLPSTTLMPLLALQRVEALARVIVGMFPPSKRSKNWYIIIMSLWWYTIQVAYDTSYIMYMPYTYTIFSYLSTSTNNYGYIFIMIIHKWGLFSFFFPYGANVSLRPLKRTWRTGQSWGRHGLADGNTGWCHRCCLVVTFWPCIFETFWDIRWI